MIYGYCRISTKKQSIDRQIRNIKAQFPDAVLLCETYTGTKFQGRQKLEGLISKVRADDCIVFDEVSRMSRNAEEGVRTYFELYDRGIDLVFLKQRHIDTQAYKQALGSITKMQLASSGDEATDVFINAIMDAVDTFMRAKVKADIEKAFEQAEKEVTDLHQRTKEGLVTAALNGKRIGQVKGSTWETKKAVESKKKMLQLCKDFGGTNTDIEVIAITGISRKTFYKYKKELHNEAADKSKNF